MPASKNKAHTRRKASDTVRVAITLPGRGMPEGPVKFSGAITSDTMKRMQPDDNQVASTSERLTELGFEITNSGKFSISARCSRDLYETLFGTKLTRHQLPFSEGERRQSNAFFFPEKDAPWNPRDEFARIIDDAYIQWPHIYMNTLFPGSIPPTVSYHHLRVPGDVTMLLNADRVHRSGITGKGVKVVMVDSGFVMDHAYFTSRGYQTQTVLAPGATDPELDGNGHGTAESANLLAMAPDVEFIGVKLDNEAFPANGATILEGLQTAMQHNPRVISVSLGHDMCPSNVFGERTSNMHLTALPNSLKALEAEIRAIAASGTIVVFSAGNGHVAFPGMMPEVISAGGVFVARDGAMQASDYASAFSSKIYPGRNVPDACGLVGLASNGAQYIMLPLQPNCETDRQNGDGTATDDGWAVISGTSAAAPQLAGAIALMLERNPGLTADEIKSVFDQTSRDVAIGSANPASNENNGGMTAGPGRDGATGPGLVDVTAALALI